MSARNFFRQSSPNPLRDRSLKVYTLDMSKTPNISAQISAELRNLSQAKEKLQARMGVYQTADIFALADQDEDTDRTQWAREFVRINARACYLISCEVRAMLPSPAPGCWA